MLIFTVILASTLLLASFGLMSVAEPSCERRRRRREPVAASIRVAVRPLRPSFAGSGWRFRTARRSPRSMSLAQAYRTA